MDDKKEGIFSFRILNLTLVFPLAAAMALALWHLGGAPGLPCISLVIATIVIFYLPRLGFILSSALIAITSFAYPWSSSSIWSICLPMAFVSAFFLISEGQRKKRERIHDLKMEIEQSQAALKQVQDALLEAQRFSAQCLKENEVREAAFAENSDELKNENATLKQELQTSRTTLADLEIRLKSIQNVLQRKEQDLESMQDLQMAFEQQSAEQMQKLIDALNESRAELFQTKLLKEEQGIVEDYVDAKQLRYQLEEKRTALNETRRQLFELETLCTLREKAEEEKEREPQVEEEKILSTIKILEDRIEDLESENCILEEIVLKALKPSSPKKKTRSKKAQLLESLELTF